MSLKERIGLFIWKSLPESTFIYPALHADEAWCALAKMLPVEWVNLHNIFCLTFSERCCLWIIVHVSNTSPKFQAASNVPSPFTNV